MQIDYTNTIMKLVVATGNTHKLGEYKRLLPEHELIVLSDKVKVEETGKNLRENAILKAKAYAKKTNLPVLADDTGLFIDCLHGRPGIRSARWANRNFEVARIRILSSLKSVPRAKRTARFECVIAWYESRTREIKTFKGIASGLINQSEAGTAGFDYDSIFYSTKLKKTFGEASAKEKDGVSHRAKALAKLKKYLIIAQEL